jgi:hypothetical protein
MVSIIINNIFQTNHPHINRIYNIRRVIQNYRRIIWIILLSILLSKKLMIFINPSKNKINTMI